MEGVQEAAEERGAQREDAPKGNVEFNGRTLIESVGGDIEIALQLASAFLEESPEQMAFLRQAVNNKDFANINRAAHAIKGSVSNFGIRRVVETAVALEKLGEARQLEHAENLVEDLESQIRQANETMKKFVEGQASLKPQS